MGRTATERARFWLSSKNASATAPICSPPTQSSIFPQLDDKEASSGQAVSRALDLIEGDYLDDTVTTVLLDEWNANLDECMRAEHDRKLGELAQRKCVIEVLHNKHAQN